MRPINLISILLNDKSSWLFLSSLNYFLMLRRRLIFNILRILTLSIFTKILFFHGLFFFETLTLKNSKLLKSNNLSYSFYSNSGLDFVSTNTNGKKLKSCESFFFSLRWQEREASEFLNINFTQKSDKRSLYLTPNFGLYPLQKDFPTVGFFEISLHSVFGLTYSRVFYK